VWWLTLGALVLWNLLVFWPRAEPVARVPYTRFLAAVRADDVTRVRIVGDEITAWLAKPLAWPEQTAGTQAKAVEGAQTYAKIATTLPAVVGDPRLLELLEAHHVEVTAEHPAAPWLMDLLTGWGPLLLLLGFFWWTGQKAMGQQAGLFGFGRTRARRYKPEGPQVTFDDVAGADEAKAELQEEVDFLRHPQKYHDLGARIPRGVLLVGPPGTGKTLLARAVAGEAGVPFFSLSGSEFVEMFVGVGASRVRDLFAQAKAAAPAIVFIDELDAVGRRRGAGFGAVNDEREQTLNQLLVEMDGFDERHEVIVLAATNRPDVLDPALLRPGRFDRKVEVGLPDRKGREGILRIHTRRLRLAPDVALDQLARATTGLSGADLANLCNEAALLAARAGRSEVTMADFSEAEDKALLGGRRRLVLPAAERRVIAYHESGHALVAWLTPAADPVQKVTIVPHGRALGVTAQQPGEDRYNYSLSYLLARLTVMLGGRTAEEIAVGDVTTGAENDLVEATRLARHMVTRWGMGALGLATFGHDGQQPFLGYDLAQGRDYSEATAARIDEEVRRLLDDRHEAARRLLTGARAALDRLVDALLREETVTLPELERLLGPRPAAPPTPGALPESP
jgi:cell division protease FtsH